MSNYFSSSNEGCLSAFVKVILILIFAFLLDLLFAWPFMLLWNWLMPMLFGFKVLSFWQAFGLMILASMLFKGSTVNTNN